MAAPNEALLDEHLAAENAHDLDRIMATYGAAAPFMVLNGQRLAGADAIRAFHRGFGFGSDGSFSEVQVTERARHRTPEAIIIQQTLSGVHTGAWQQLPPTGKRFEVEVCTVYRFDDAGMLASEHVYFDLALLARQLR